MSKVAAAFLLLALFASCDALIDGGGSGFGTVISFQNEAHLRSQLLQLVNAEKRRVRRGAAAGSANLNRAKRQAAGASAFANYSLEDDHDYYKKKVSVNHERTLFLSKEFDRIFDTYPSYSHVRMNNAHNLAWIVPTNFEFPFYGHPHNHIVITTAGYLYINNVTHRQLGFAQYIAPLMANFDTLHPISRIKFVDAEDSVWVRWENMQLNENRSFGNFSFQCGVYKNGSVVFDYISLPSGIRDLRNFTKFRVAVGMSDAFYNDTRLNATHIRRLIVRYHSIDIDLSLVTNDTVVEFSHLTTCNQLKSCWSCVDPNLAKNFNCSWCKKLETCSSGVDRSVQKWMSNACHTATDPCESTSTSTTSISTSASAATSTSSSASTSAATSTSTSASTSTSTSTSTRASTSAATSASTSTSTSAATSTNAKEPTPQARRNCVGQEAGCRKPLSAAIVMVVVLAVVVVGGLIASLVVLLVYGYRHPNSGVGMWLIENRPSQLRQRVANIRFFKSGDGGGGSSGGDAYKVDMGSTYANMDA